MEMEDRPYMKERPWYYRGMTDEDDMYIFSELRKSTDMNFIDNLLHRKSNLPPVPQRTKEDVFTALDLDLNYIFDIKTMC